jgi:nitrous oxidase accessory protein NosD
VPPLQTGPPDAKELEKQVGPQKPCPADPNDKWDEDYLKRHKLQANTSVYVDAAEPEGGDGTRGKPFREIQKAVDSAQSDAVVLLAPGTYNWGLRINKQLHLVGRCTEGVRIVAKAGSSGAGISVTGEGATLEGFSILGGGYAPGWGIDIRHIRTSHLRHIRIEQAHELGISVYRGGVEIEHVEIAQTSRKSFGRGINLQDLTGKAVIRHNHILKNAQIGIFASNCVGMVLEGNLIAETGIQNKDGSGIALQEMKGKAVIRRNHILKNTNRGIFAANCVELEIDGNLIVENGTQNKDGGGIVLQDLTGKAVIRHNHILKNAALGIFAERCVELEIDGNLIAENGTQNKDGRGINLQDLTGKAVIRHNHILKNAQYGVFAERCVELEIDGNLIAENGTQNKDGRGINLQDLTGKAVIRHNHILKNADLGIFAWRCVEMELEGNLISENGTQNKESKGIGLQDLKGKAVIRRNHILKNARHGIFASQCLELELEGNLIAENGNEGIHFQHVAFKVSLSQNTMAAQEFGGSLSLIRGEVKLSENVWASNRHGGLRLERNSGMSVIRGGQFIDNGNSHIEVLNNRGELSVEKAILARGKFSHGMPSQGQSESAGMGIHAGATGLVRWVFAKDADYPCSPTQKKQVPILPNGWSMRPVRVPYDLDPCYSWRSGRDDEQRKNLSACGQKCGSDQRCRWIWKNVIPGVWEPYGLECVTADQPDTCGTPITDTSPLQIVNAEYAFSGGRGSCVELDSPADDPCNTPEMHACNQKVDKQGNKIAYCSRRQRELNQPLIAFCSPRAYRKTTGCPLPDAEEQICKENQVCVDSMAVLWPMDAYPSNMTLWRNVFWGNPGPDVFMDMAGTVRLEDNTYHFCVPGKTSSSCEPKVGYQFCLPSPDDHYCRPSQHNPKRGYKRANLPAGATLVWQNLSPFYTFKGYGSDFSGNDRNSLKEGMQILYEPDYCDIFASN